MKTIKCCKPLCLLVILLLLPPPGIWAQSPDGKPNTPAAKQGETAAENAAPEEEFDRPIRPGPNPMNVATDALILRPVGLIMIPVTAIIYVIGYPFAKSAGTEEDAYKALVGDTIDYTFKRPLGEGAPFE